MTDRIEEGDVVVVTSRTGFAAVKVGMFGTVNMTQKYEEERFVRVAFDDHNYWLNSGDVELALDPLYILSEEYFH